MEDCSVWDDSQKVRPLYKTGRGGAAKNQFGNSESPVPGHVAHNYCSACGVAEEGDTLAGRGLQSRSTHRLTVCCSRVIHQIC